MNIHKVSPSHGHFYTIPTSSEIVADGQDGLWLTEFKGGKSNIIFLLENQMMTSVNLLTAVVDTDYDNWAVFVQCMTEDGKNKFLSTRVMSRAKTLSADQWLLVKETMQVIQKYLIYRKLDNDVFRLRIWRVVSNTTLIREIARFL